MKKIILPLLLLLGTAPVFAQSAKKLPLKPTHPPRAAPSRLGQNHTTPLAIPTAENPFGLPAAQFHALPALVPFQDAPAAVRVTRGDNGLPILFEGETAASANDAESAPAAVQALQYLASLQLPGIALPMEEFTASTVQSDEQGDTHVRLNQVFQGVPVYGSELIAHRKNGAFALLNGRYYPSPTLATLTPELSSAQAIGKVIEHIGAEKVKTQWTPQEKQLVGGQPFVAELVIYHLDRKLDGEHLAWHITAHPNLLNRLVYFVDARTGEILHHFDHTCQIAGDRLPKAKKTEPVIEEQLPAAALPGLVSALNLVDGKVMANGTDLLNMPRSFGGWQSGSIIVLEDASKGMFDSITSQMPNDPVGAIVTLTAQNTSPQLQNFAYAFNTSNALSFADKTAVSAHWNSIKSYEYYENTFGRKAIDGVGGNILAFTNVADEDGSSMENAFWNGNAMWYGNGGSTFKKLAAGLDVGGHEMTHGVVEKTANLEYQDESGALNESFADVFGAMIDRDDWKIGEDVMQAGVNPNNALRDLSNPHNSVSSSSQWWQPNHVNEKFNGNSDNGGVHINSGIPNYAFYLFANHAAVGKDKAEQVYYKALRDYLVKSSQFVDARIAVIQAANDLYGSTVANAAAAAFTTVGINGNQPGGNYQGQLAVNPGTDLILTVSDDAQNLDLAVANGQVLGSIFVDGVYSRPSIRDNGTEAVFVSNAGQIIHVGFAYNGTLVTPTLSLFDNQTFWRNVAISKNGRFIAASTDDEDNRIYMIDRNNPGAGVQTFYLYNPTYTQGQVTGDVQYADVLEFDYSGEYLMYDAYNQLAGPTGDDISYWDIGFLQFWENGQFADGTDAFISKLFGGLPENTSIGNPAIAKNSPYIIAFDYRDELNNRNDIYGANVETGDYNIIAANIGDYGWPNYNRLDNGLIYHQFNSSGTAYNLRLQGLAPDKIQGQGGSSQLVSNHQLGVWFANGNRSLAVGTEEEQSDIRNLELSPNPTTDRVHLRFKALETSTAQIHLLNLLGETLQSQSMDFLPGQNEFDLNLQGLPMGTYLVHLSTGKTQVVVKVVKQD